ncbi:MAG: hypothetical protein MI923_26390 [Phycisphaerales bacterium]|nr:hypothetical protein [Phycisphaerales bacterium]
MSRRQGPRMMTQSILFRDGAAGFSAPNVNRVPTWTYSLSYREYSVLSVSPSMRPRIDTVERLSI